MVWYGVLYSWVHQTAAAATYRRTGGISGTCSTWRHLSEFVDNVSRRHLSSSADTSFTVAVQANTCWLPAASRPLAPLSPVIMVRIRLFSPPVKCPPPSPYDYTSVVNSINQYLYSQQSAERKSSEEKNNIKHKKITNAQNATTQHFSLNDYWGWQEDYLSII